MTYTTPPFNAAVAFDGTRDRSLMDILVPAVGGKWVVFIVRALSGSPLCFTASFEGCRNQEIRQRICVMPIKGFHLS
jgi:hypothetical protein